MKPQIALSPSEMEELKSLGLDCSDASMVWKWKGETEPRLHVNTLFDDIRKDYERFGYTPAYTLEDILMKLPPVIDDALLTIQKLDKRALLWQNEVTWGIAYMTCEYDSEDTFSTHSTGARKVFMTNDLITGLVEMFKWVLQNYPDKIKRL